MFYSEFSFASFFFVPFDKERMRDSGWTTKHHQSRKSNPDNTDHNLTPTSAEDGADSANMQFLARFLLVQETILGNHIRSAPRTFRVTAKSTTKTSTTAGWFQKEFAQLRRWDRS